MEATADDIAKLLELSSAIDKMNENFNIVFDYNNKLKEENKQLQTKLDIAVGAIKEIIDGNGDRCKDCKINVQTGIEALQQIKENDK